MNIRVIKSNGTSFVCWTKVTSEGRGRFSSVGGHLMKLQDVKEEIIFIPWYYLQSVFMPYSR